METLSSTSKCMECEKEGLFLAKDETGFYYISCCFCGTIFFKFKTKGDDNDQLSFGRMFGIKFNQCQQALKNPSQRKNG